MSAAAAHSDTAAIDAALAKGEWWVRLFDDLSERAAQRGEALDVRGPGGLRQAVNGFVRAVRALSLAVVAAMRLEGFLAGLARLRTLAPAELAAVRARAKAKAEAEAAAREAARERARARRAARAAQVRERLVEVIARETPARRDRDPLVEALDRRLAVDPALVDLDDLPLRETVERICADLGITPDWARWEADDWATETPPPESIDPPIDPPINPRVGPPPAPRASPPATARNTRTRRRGRRRSRRSRPKPHPTG